jgi:hypothetical protein
VRKAVLIAFAVVAALAVLPFVATFAFYATDSMAGGCSEGEMRVFREFPQYGGRRLEPDYRAENGCFVAFTTEDQPQSVRTYYKEQLTARGWTLDPPPPAVEAAEGRSEAGGISAARGRYGYEALLESPVRGGTSVVVYVIERDE